MNEYTTNQPIGSTHSDKPIYTSVNEKKRKEKIDFYSAIGIMIIMVVAIVFLWGMDDDSDSISFYSSNKSIFYYNSNDNNLNNLNYSDYSDLKDSKLEIVIIKKNDIIKEFKIEVVKTKK